MRSRLHRHLPPTCGQVMEPNQVRMLALPVPGDAQQIIHTLESRFTGEIAGEHHRQRSRPAPTLRANASALEFVQVAPAIAAVKLSRRAVQPLGTKSLVEPVRGVCRIAEQQHGGHAALQEAARDGAQQHTAKTLALNAQQQINLVELAGIAGNAAVVRGSLEKPTSSPPSSSTTKQNRLPSFLSNASRH
jgi:hypothetical protein